MDLGEWLRSLGLEQYMIAFRENGIDRNGDAESQEDLEHAHFGFEPHAVGKHELERRGHVGYQLRDVGDADEQAALCHLQRVVVEIAEPFVRDPKRGRHASAARQRIATRAWNCTAIFRASRVIAPRSSAANALSTPDTQAS